MKTNYQKNYRSLKFKLHLDWHQPGWVKAPGSAFTKVEARRQAALIRDAGFQSVSYFFYDHHGYPFYPSKIASHHPSINTAYAGRFIEALHAEGVQVVAYVSVLTSLSLFKKHPDWYIRNAKGEYPNFGWLTEPNEWICASSPFVEKFFIPLLEEILDLYPVDGFWLDALCWAQEVEWSGLICQCDRCKTKFRAFSGFELPLEKPSQIETCSSSEKEKWAQWVVFRTAQIMEIHRQMREAIDKKRPGLPLIDNNLGQISRPFPKVENGKFQRWLGNSELPVEIFSCDPVPFGGNHSMILSYQARHQITTGKAFDYMNERFNGWGEWQTRSRTDWELEFKTILINGGTCYFADQPCADGTLYPVVYPEIKKAVSATKKLGRLTKDSKIIPDVAVLGALASQRFSLPFLHDPIKATKPPEISDRLFGAHRVLQELGIQYHLYDDQGIQDHGNELRLIIVPDQEALSDETIQFLEKFVHRGGSLLLTGGAGRFTDLFSERKAWALAELAGVEWIGERPSPIHYFEVPELLIKKSPSLLPIPLQCWGRSIEYRAKKAKAIASIYEPLEEVWKGGVRQRKHFQHHTVTGACPPAAKPSGSSLFLNSYGKGKVLTVAMDPFARYSVEGHRQLRFLIESLCALIYPEAERKVVTIKKPLHVEVSVMQEGDQVLVHAINFFTQKSRSNMVTAEELSLTDPFEVSLKLDRPIKSARDLNGKKVVLKRRGNRTIIKIPAFRVSETIICG